MNVRRKIGAVFSLLLVMILFLPYSNASAAGPVPVITKNPTSEAIAIGGKTWFIAHADNATSMTWELVDVNGNIYSLADATAMHPGLRLEALEGDTIAVSNVPASINGWAVQATFYGQGGSVTTSPAYIYVGDFLKSYSSIIDQYRYAVSLGADINAQITYDLGISECVTYSEKVGYALKDLDKNGIPELMIGGINYYWEDAPMVYDLYTLNSINQPVQLCVSWPRSRNYLLIDNRIMNEGSGGASSSGFILKKVNGTSLEFLEGYWSSNSTDNSGTTMYHTTVEDNGFFDIYDDTMPSQQGFAIGEALKEKAWMPGLTLIAIG
ncbi:MAG: hypothetical protein J6M64_03385 [Oscillospiraceae bacterium]|nr:hypothetical protein [Oscillospiraceae bacterium]